MKNYLRKRHIEAVIFLIIFISFFGYISSVMGTKNLLSTLMTTAHDLLLNTVFYIISITVLAGAFGELLIEFGVVRLLELVLAPLMKPIFNLPGVASLGALMTFFSDNPAIITLVQDKNFSSYFKREQLVSLTNFGTAFGMGLVVLTFMIGQGFILGAFVGLFGSIVGAVISTRLMQFLLRNQTFEITNYDPKQAHEEKIQFDSEDTLFLRIINSILDGGKKGVDIGLSIIPGVLIISSLVMLTTYGPKDASLGYQGLAYEGVPILPFLGSKIQGFFHFLFGFESAELIAFPITSLGAVGAALSLIPSFIEKGIITGNEIAVFTAMGMCWSGYLSTHTAMLDVLKLRKLTSKAIISHTVGGLCAGICAHFAFKIITHFV